MTMINQKHYVISEEDANIRLDVFLSGLYEHLSRSFIQKQIKSENVLVNDNPQKVSYFLKTDDVIVTDFTEESSFLITPQNIPLDIKYEDPSMLVVNKPTGMLTHPTTTEKENTLVNALLFYTNGVLSDCNGINRPGIVHRLDRNTSGLLMIAKNNEAFEFIKKQIQEHTIEKKYYAVVCGVMENNSGTINKPIARSKSKPEKMSIDINGKPSVTHYRVIERLNGYTFLDITLETGRTHQIRVHLASENHPIVNDTMYGGTKVPVNTDFQVLQSYSLQFVSPYDQKQRDIVLEPDNVIIKTLNYLRNNS